MGFLLNLVSRVGIARAATKLNLARPLVSAIRRGIRRPTTVQLKKFRSVFRATQYQRLKAVGFGAKIARQFRDYSMRGVSDRVKLMNQSVNNLALRRLEERRIRPKNVDEWLRDTRREIRHNMKLSDKEWKDLEYPTIEY